MSAAPTQRSPPRGERPPVHTPPVHTNEQPHSIENPVNKGFAGFSIEGGCPRPRTHTPEASTPHRNDPCCRTTCPTNDIPQKTTEGPGRRRSAQDHQQPGPQQPQDKCRRRPTLPHPPRCSTIGAGRLSFRVRKGTGRDPTAKTTDKHTRNKHTPNHNPHNNKGPRLVCCAVPDTAQ